MNNKPMPLTHDEIEEIAGIENIQQMWGAFDAAEMADTLENHVYAVKFNFHSGGPGYVGEYFILAGDALGEPVQLIRRDRRLVLL
jgi:hypothetical protein